MVALKKIVKELPSKNEVENLFNKVEILQVQMDALLKQKKTQALESQKELFLNLPMDEELNQAVADISSQIKIKISQDFKTIVEENNYKINQYSIQILESQINNNLEEVEIMTHKLEHKVRSFLD